MKKIGILSGMGAAAGARFYNILIEECQRRGAKDDCDFPEVVIYNLSSKGMDKTGICNDRVIKSDLLKAIYQLDLCGVDIIVMACNSVHIYYDYLQSHTKAQILNMVESAQNAAGCSQSGIVSSRSTRKSGLYRGLHVTDEQQAEVDSIIGRAIAGRSIGLQRAQDQMTLYGIIDSLISSGAGTVILGCTELPLVIDRRMAVIDPAEIVIREALAL